MINSVEGQLNDSLVCVAISGIPDGGLSCPVTVAFDVRANEDLKNGMF